MCCMFMCLLQGAAGGFDRAAWLALLQPLVKLWEQLLALAPPALRQAVSGGGGSAAAAAGSTSSGVSQLGPVDSFVGLERAFGVALLQLVARTMAGVEAVLAGEALAAAVQVSAGLPLETVAQSRIDVHDCQHLCHTRTCSNAAITSKRIRHTHHKFGLRRARRDICPMLSDENAVMPGLAACRIMRWSVPLQVACGAASVPV